MISLLVTLRTFFRPLLAMRKHWLQQYHPIFRFEMRRVSRSAGARVNIGLPALRIPDMLRSRRAVFVGVLLLGAFAVLVPGGAWFIVSMGLQLLMSAGGLAIGFFILFAIIPFIPWLWRIPTVLFSAVPVAREVERRRWLILRSTLYSTREILGAFHAATTYRVLMIWSYITGIRMMVGVLLIVPLGVALVGEIFSFLYTLTGAEMPTSGPRFMLVSWLAYLISFLYFLSEPYLDVAIDGALGLLASTMSRRPLSAMLGGLALRVVGWVFQMGVVFLMFPWHMENRSVFAIMGPGYALWFGVVPEAAIASVLLWAGVRVGFLHLVLRLAVWRVERVG